MAVPELPEGRIRIPYAARASAITDLRTAVFDDHFVHRIVEDFLDVLDVFRCKANGVVVVVKVGLVFFERTVLFALESVIIKMRSMISGF